MILLFNFDLIIIVGLLVGIQNYGRRTIRRYKPVTNGPSLYMVPSVYLSYHRTVRRYRFIRRYNFIATPIIATGVVRRYNDIPTDGASVLRLIPTTI
jgi:hypothetical protein